MLKDNPHIERSMVREFSLIIGDRTNRMVGSRKSYQKYQSKSNLCPCEHLRTEGCKIRCGKKFGAKT